MTNKIRLTILSFWLGVAALFSFLVAPKAFKVLPTKKLAGDIVGSVLGGVEWLGIAVGAILVALALYDRRTRIKTFLLELFGACLLIATMVASHFWVSRAMHALRVKYGEELWSLPLAHTGGEAFSEMHMFSEGLMGINLLVTLILLGLALRTPKPLAHTAPQAALSVQTRHA